MRRSPDWPRGKRWWLMTEWRPIPSIPNHSASSVGEIRNDLTGTIRKYVTTSNGYKIVGFGRRGANICRSVHSLVAEAFLGPKPHGHQVRHLDGVRANCSASNLAYGTPLENAADRERHGNTCRGDKNGNRIVSSDQVEELRALYAAGGVSQYDLADRYGISQAQVNNIVLRKQWRPAPMIGGAE